MNSSKPTRQAVWAARAAADELRALLEPYSTKIIKDEKTKQLAIEAIRLIDEEQAPTHTHEEAGAMGGRGKKAIRITNSFETGTETRGYTLARLKRERPDLAEKVEGRKLVTM